MESSVLQAKLKAFALMLKFSNDLFTAKDFKSCANMAVSNGRVLLGFRNSAIVELQNGRAEVIAQYGLEQVNVHAKLALLQCKLITDFKFENQVTILTKEEFGDIFGSENVKYLCLKLEPPQSLETNGLAFIWLLEYVDEIPEPTQNTATLLGASIANALYFQRLCKKNSWKNRHKSGRRWVWLSFLILLVGAMFIPTHTRSTAEFSIQPAVKNHSYAWINGQIKACYLADGERVVKGALVAEYDTNQLIYKYDIAKATLQELLSELELERKNAFTDQTKLGVVKLLEAKLRTAELAVAEAKWSLEKAKIYAPSDGVISFEAQDKNSLKGKVVGTGEIIFSVFGGEVMEGEILLNERDASLLNGELGITMFLYTAPEKAIEVTVLSISSYPKINLQNSYCYTIRVALPKDLENLRYGMRGVARLSGEKKPLGYNLFKDMLLYFRGL